MQRQGRRRMNEARFTDDIKYGNVATENCADAVMKTL